MHVSSRLSRNIPSVSLLHCPRTHTVYTGVHRHVGETCALVDFLLLLTLFPPCLSRNNVGRTWAFLLATARCVGGGNEEKRRRARMTVTWHRSGLLFCPDLSVFREVLCCDCVRPSLRPQPRATPLGKRSRTLVFSPAPSSLVLFFDSYERKNRFCLTRSCKRNATNDDELNFLRWSKRLIRKHCFEQGSRERLVEIRKKIERLTRAIIVFLEVTRSKEESLRKKR